MSRTMRRVVSAWESQDETAGREATVVSDLTALPNRDVVIAGHQQAAHEWWDTRRQSYELGVSQLVRTPLFSV